MIAEQLTTVAFIVSSNYKFTQFGCLDGYDLHPFKTSGYISIVILIASGAKDFPICIQKCIAI